MKRDGKWALLLAAALFLILWQRVGSRDSGETAHEASAAPSAHLPANTRVSLAALRQALAPTPAEEDAAQGIDSALVTVSLDDSGSPLAGARVTLVIDGQDEATMAADERGRATFPLPGTWPLIVLSGHAGHAPAHEFLAGPPSDAIFLRLAAERRVEGAISLVQGGAPDGPMWVIAIPTRIDLAVGGDELPRVLASSEVVKSSTDQEGRFTLGGLAANESYRIWAGGAGLFVAEQVMVVPAEAEFVQLEALQAYSILLHFVDDLGPAHTQQGFGRNGALSFSLARASARLVPGDNISARLCVYPELTEIAPNERLFFAGSAELMDSVGPLTVSMNLAGYEPFSAGFQLCPASPASTEVTLLRRATGWGEIELEIAGEPGLEDSACRYGPRAMVSLSGEEGTSMTKALDGPLFGLHLLKDIPQGDYRISVWGEPETFRVPSDAEERRVTVGTARERVRFELTGMGAVVFDVLSSEGQAYEGELALGLGRGPVQIGALGNRSFSWRPAVFHRPPFLLPALEPGHYLVMVTKPQVDVEVLSFFVTSGQATRVPLRLPPRR